MTIFQSQQDRSEIAANKAVLDMYMDALPEELSDTEDQKVWQYIEGGSSVEDMIIELASEMGLDELVEEYEMEIAA